MSAYYDDTGLTSRAWFKPLVALWFAALAAAGMWFMPPDVHSAILRGTGLSSLHPMLAVPASRTGVIALCVVAGLLGLLIGLLIAWRIAAAGKPRGFAHGFASHEEADWSDDEPLEEPRRRRVFSAREDIGEEGIAISAPVEGDGEEAPYEEEYTIEDIPAAAPQEDFESVYAEMESDAFAPEEDGEVDPFDRNRVGDYAEYDEVEEEERIVEAVITSSFAREAEEAVAPQTPETGPASSPEPLGDMSLDALVGRLGSALDQHRRLVAGSENAAREPAPRPIPMTREPDLSAGEHEQGLPEVDDNGPVIAFLRREASRRMPAGIERERESDDADSSRTPVHSQSEAQAALRSALDRLGKANRGES